MSVFGPLSVAMTEYRPACQEWSEYQGKQAKKAGVTWRDRESGDAAMGCSAKTVQMGCSAVVWPWDHGVVWQSMDCLEL